MITEWTLERLNTDGNWEIVARSFDYSYIEGVYYDLILSHPQYKYRAGYIDH